MAYSTDFDDLADMLIKKNASTEAAEAQGLLCGMMCAAGRADKLTWLQQVLGESPDPSDILATELTTQLQALYEDTLKGMYDDESLAFKLFLPDDNVRIEEQAGALSEWVQGFLLGFSIRSLDDLHNELKEEIEGLLEDFVEITRLDMSPGDDEDEDENACMEIEEYIRMSVMFIFMSLQPAASSNRLQ